MLWKLCSKYLLSLALILVSFLASAQSANDAFNHGAKEYISGNKSLAKQITLAGLEKFPEDPKLNKLLEKIKDEEENQNQDQKNQNQKDQENQDNQDQKNQDKKDKQDENKDDKSDPKQDQDDNKKDEQKEGEQPPQPKKGQISREDAERLLNALSKEEQDVQKKVNEKKIKGTPIKTEKDW